MEWTTAKLGIAAESMLLTKQQKTSQDRVAMIVICIWTMTRVQNLINIIGGHMDVMVSLDFASAGMYAAQYAIKNSWR